MTKQAVDHSEVNVFLSKKDSKYAKELLRKSKESNWKVFRVNCSGRGESHEINSREINSNEINFREINFLKINSSRDLFLFTFLYEE